MRTAIIGIQFKKGTKDDSIEEIVSNFCAENGNLIKGARYLEFKDPKTLERIYEFIEKDSVSQGAGCSDQDPDRINLDELVTTMQVLKRMRSIIDSVMIPTALSTDRERALDTVNILLKHMGV